MSLPPTGDELDKRQIMEELKRACIEGDLIEVRKYMCTVKQPSFPFKEMEKAIKPLVYWATKAGKVEVLKELIEIYKCDPHYTTERGHTLLYVACSRGHANVIKYLARNCGVNPKQTSDMLSRTTPLFVACNNGHLEAMLVLIDELKCDPNAVNEKGESLLHRACGGGHLEVVKRLITKYNLPPEARTKYMDTPLFDACAKGHLPVVQYLIEMHGCQITVFNVVSSSPLHIACRNGHSNVVRYLVVEQKCDVTQYDNSGSTPLHLACKFRRRDVVRILLESGRIDPNLPTLAGEVPIMISKDPEVVRSLIRSGAKPVGEIPDVLQEFVKKAPLDSLVHIFMIGHSEAGKSTLAQALQMPISTTFGGLITRASTVTNDPGRTAGIIPMEFKSPDFGRVLLYDFAGHPEYHASHGALLEHFNTNTAPLFLLVVDLNEGMTDVQRKLDYWLSFVEVHRLPGVSPPRVMIIGSHYDLLKKRTPAEECAGFIARLGSYIRSRLKQSRLCLDGFFTMDCRQPKRHRELRHCLKKSCEDLRVRERIDSCCHVLAVILTKEFDKQLACSVEDIIQKVETYPIPMQVDRLCDLAEELSTRMNILFLRNKKNPEKSWIVLDTNTLLSVVNGCIFALPSLSDHDDCKTPTHTGLLPWSQIQCHLPRDLDSSLIMSFLGRLEFCQVVQDPEVLSLIKFGKSDTISDSEISSPISSWSSQMSIFSSQDSISVESNYITGSRLSCYTSSSGVSSMSNYTTGSSIILSEQDATPRLPKWVANLYSSKHTQESSASSSISTREKPSIPEESPSTSQQHRNSKEMSPTIQNSAMPSSTMVFSHSFNPQHNSGEPNASSPAPPNFPIPQEPQAFPRSASSGMGGSSASPVNANSPLHHPSSVSYSFPSHLNSNAQRESSESPHFSRAATLYDHTHNLHLARATGGSQPLLPSVQEKTRVVGSRQFGSLHRSPSDSCIFFSTKKPYQYYPLQDKPPIMSRHVGYAQSPVFNNDKFLFFPGLVNSGQPSGEMWQKDESFVFYSGWCLESAQSHKFFTPRFLQTLTVRLTFGFAVSRESSDTLTSSLSLFSRECTIWKNGLRWLNLDGVETFVEMVEDGRTLLLLMRAKKGSELRGVNLRSLLIRKILDTKEECCPGMPTTEYLIHPKHLQERESYPIITGQLSQLIRYDVSIVAQAIVAEKRRKPHRFLIDTLNTNMESLANILYFDPYMYLNSDTLRKLFDPMNQDQELAEALLLEFSEDYLNDADKFKEILLDDSHYNEQNAPPNNNHCFGVLRRYWERTPNLKISDFRRDLDRHSIFSGRNILSVVHVSPDSTSPSITHKQPVLKEETCDASSFQEFVSGTFFCHSYKHMVNKYLYCTEMIASVPFLGRVEVLVFDSSGKEYESSQHRITISIPKDAIPQGEIIHLEVAVALHGPFQFSDGKRPISPILWLCPQENITFQKPITIVLPHTLTDVCNQDIDGFGIQFAKADHTDYRMNPTGKKEYIFMPYESEVELTAKKGKGIAILKADHCCFWCLEMRKQNRVSPEIARQMARKMGYFVHCVECLQSPYCSISPPRDVIHFCVSFMLDTCMKAIEDQFPLTNVQGELIHKIHTQRFNLIEPHLQLTYSTNDKDLCDVAVSNDGKIYASSVDFWEEGLGQDELKLMHIRKVYPPRVEVTVQLFNHEQRHTKLSINFDGCSTDRDSPKFQIFLPLGHNPEAAVAMALSSTNRKNGFKNPKQVYDPEWVQTVPSVPHKGDKPNLRQLQRLCKGCSKVTVLKNIAPKWQELAIEMGFEYSDIEIVDMETDKNPMNAVRKILGRWLEGTVTTDTRPLTWSTLVECLSNIECQSLADELSQILLD